MASFNRVTLMGNATRDPEVRQTKSGKQVANITLAVNKKSGEQETVAFIDVTFWERTAEIVAEYVKKGTNLLVDGEIVQDTWEQDGQKRSKLKVNAFKMVLVSRRDDAIAAKPDADATMAEETPF